MSASLSFKRGDTFQGTVLFTDAAGNPVDITGCTARMQVRSKLGNTLALDVTGLTIGGGSLYDEAGTETQIAEGNGTYGALFYAVAAEATAELTPGSYVADVELTFPDETVISSETFSVKVLKDITE